MNPVAYTVTAGIDSPQTAARYIEWLIGTGGHIRAVLSHGGTSAELTVLDPDPDESHARTRVEVRYIFPDRAALDHYLKVGAPALRAEGMRLFGPGSGVSISRRTGEVIGRA